VLEAARDAGASSAGYVLLRLPGSVKEVFSERLKSALPLHAEKVLHRIRETRGGKLYDSRFGTRGEGEGLYASTIAALFEVACRNLGLNASHRPSVQSSFQRPRERRQLTLF
jgi:DNA repair photolyase